MWDFAVLSQNEWSFLWCDGNYLSIKNQNVLTCFHLWHFLCSVSIDVSTFYYFPDSTKFYPAVYSKGVPGRRVLNLGEQNCFFFAVLYKVFLNRISKRIANNSSISRSGNTLCPCCDVWKTRVKLDFAGFIRMILLRTFLRRSRTPCIVEWCAPSGELISRFDFQQNRYLSSCYSIQGMRTSSLHRGIRMEMEKVDV